MYAIRSYYAATIVTYGGNTNVVLNILEKLFVETDFKFELFVLTRINPIDYDVIIESVKQTKTLFVVEEGSTVGGIGRITSYNVCYTKLLRC